LQKAHCYVRYKPQVALDEIIIFNVEKGCVEAPIKVIKIEGRMSIRDIGMRGGFVDALL
jgi:hypothetical protein